MRRLSPTCVLRAEAEFFYASQRFDKLEAAGFKLLRYGDLFAHTLGRGGELIPFILYTKAHQVYIVLQGGHYVDIGCSELIADGHVSTVPIKSIRWRGWLTTAYSYT